MKVGFALPFKSVSYKLTLHHWEQSLEVNDTIHKDCVIDQKDFQTERDGCRSLNPSISLMM